MSSIMSRPAWARGLKRFAYGFAFLTIKSRPAWARGLKHVNIPALQRTLIVAPRVGAWIETTVAHAI